MIDTRSVSTMTDVRLRVFALTVVILMGFQGCLSASDVSTMTEDESDENVFPGYNPDEYQCFVHNDWERCYITYIPPNR